MEFCKTRTFQNLAASFAGECQAGMRYQMVATQAQQAGLQTLAETVRSIAHNETAHARAFYQGITDQTKKALNIQLNSEYPFWFGSLAENLAYAAKGEHHEFEEVYPTFAKIAEEEGFSVLSKLWMNIAKIESHHEVIFGYLHDAYENGSLFKSESQELYICSECGYMHTAGEAWKVCPVCKKEQGYVELHLPFGGV